MGAVRIYLPHFKGSLQPTSLSELIPDNPALPVPETARHAKQDCPTAIDVLPALRAAADTKPPAVDVGPDDPAALNYTGGTTGLPKGCVHTQRAMIYTAATTCTCAGGTGRDNIILNFHPVFWIAGENVGVIFPVFAGATVVCWRDGIRWRG